MRKTTLGLLLAAALSTACRENSCARSGGSMTVDLPRGQKLVNCTWKGSEFWYLIRSMRADEAPETWMFQEKSDLGLLEGKVTIKESR